jgi:hypothetical protein
MGETAQVLLPYGRSDPLRRRVRIAVQVLTVACVIVAAFEPVQHAVYGTRDYLQCYFARRSAEADCMRFAAPRGTVIVDEAPLRSADRLLIRSGNAEPTLATSNASDTSAERAARHAVFAALSGPTNPECWRRFRRYAVLSTGSPGRVRYASCLRSLPSFFAVTQPAPAVLMLHARRAKGGPPRLVCLTFNAGAFEWTGSSPFQAFVYADGGFARSLLCWSGPLSDPAFHRQEQPLKIYAGEPDPLDESHFTVRFDVGPEPHILDGRLTDDDHVILGSQSVAFTTCPS